MDADRLRPGGKAPELMDQEYGVVPPEAVRVAAYPEFTWPDESEVLTTATGGTEAAIKIENDFDEVWGVGLESLTDNVKLNVPD